MKLLRRYSQRYAEFLYTISEWTAGNNTLSFIIGMILSLGSVFLSFMLISRINAYNADPFEENFTEAKKMKKITKAANSIMALWIILNFINAFLNFQFGGTRVVFLLIGAVSYAFTWYSLKKFSNAKRTHSIEFAKANKGDPSIVMAENFGLTQEQKETVSMIVGNAGVSNALKNPMSDEELFGPIDDPVYDDPHTPRIVCRSCGKVNNPKHNICAYCGAALDKTKTTPASEYQSEIDKILNGTKDEDPVQMILRNAGVIQTDGGKYVSVKKTAKTGIDINPAENKENSVNTVTPTTNKKEDKSITVTPLPKSSIITPSPIDDSIKVTALKGTDFYKNDDDGLTETALDKSDVKADNSVKDDSDENALGGAEEQLRCPFCGEMNDKNNMRCIFCGTNLEKRGK